MFVADIDYALAQGEHTRPMVSPSHFSNHTSDLLRGIEDDGPLKPPENWRPRIFTIKVRKHTRRWESSNGIDGAVMKLRRKFRGGVRADALCKGDAETCVSKIIRAVEVLDDYRKKTCKGSVCGIDDALKTAASTMKMTLRDSKYDLSQNVHGCDTRECWIKKLFRLQRFILGEEDVDEEFGSCESCAIADLLGIFKRFLKKLKKVLSDRGRGADVFCERNNWVCLLKMTKATVDLRRGRSCEVCSDEYDCALCIKTNHCDFCTDVFGCGPCKEIDCVGCLKLHECRYCRRQGCKCDLLDECERCLEENNCDYCQDSYKCKCKSPYSKMCSRCLKRKSCKYCKGQYGCHCDNQCEMCLSEHKCSYCFDLHSCRCKPSKKEICEDCLEYQGCMYCMDRHNCDCEEDCDECMEKRSCPYCRKRFGCKCGNERKCERCLERRSCAYCHRKYNCYCTSRTTSTEIPDESDRRIDEPSKMIRTTTTTVTTTTNQGCSIPDHQDCCGLPNGWRWNTDKRVKDILSLATKRIFSYPPWSYYGTKEGDRFWISVSKNTGSARCVTANATGPGLSYAISYPRIGPPPAGGTKSDVRDSKRCDNIAIWVFWPGDTYKTDFEGFRGPKWSCYGNEQPAWSCPVLGRWADQFYTLDDDPLKVKRKEIHELSP